MALLLIEGFEANTPSGGSFSFGEMESHYRSAPRHGNVGGQLAVGRRVSIAQPGCTRLL